MSTQVASVGLDVQALRIERRKAKLTQREVSTLVGSCEASVLRWENGTRMPDATMLLRLSVLYGVQDVMAWAKVDADGFHLPAEYAKSVIKTPQLERRLARKRRERRAK